MSRSNSEILALVVSSGWRRRHLIALPILIMPFIGLVAGFIAPKIFEARMTILVQEPDKLNPILNDLAIGANLQERMPALLALLKSKHVLADVLRDLGQNGGLSTDEEEVRVGNLAAALSGSLIGSEMIELKIRGPKAFGLAKTLSAVGVRFLDHVIAPGRGAVEGSETFLQAQLVARTAELTKAEQAYADFKAKNSDKLPALYTTNVTRLAAMQQSLEEKRIELSTAEARFEDLRSRAGTLNPVLGRLEESIIQVSGELAGLRARYTDEHSDVQAAARKLHRLEEQRAALLASSKGQNGGDMERMWNLAAGVTTSEGEKSSSPLLVAQMSQILEADGRRAGLKKEVEQLGQGVERLRAAMAEFAPIEEQQQQLERAITSAREMHDMLVKRFEMARLTGSLGRYEAPDRIKIIDMPQDPNSPVTPGKLLFVIGGLFGGLILGIGLAVVFEFMDPRLRLGADFEKASGLSVLADLSALTSAVSGTGDA